MGLRFPDSHFEAKKGVKNMLKAFQKLFLEFSFALGSEGSLKTLGICVQPRIGPEKRILVIDPHRECDYRPLDVRYDRTAPATQNPLFEMFSLSNIWSDVDRIARDLIRELQSRKENVSVRFDVVDPNAESMIVTEALKRMTQMAWDPEILLVVEEASKFDCRAVVSRGRHCGIQALLLSQYPLADEVMSNTKVLLGPISSGLIENCDPLAASAILDLREHEFLWEETKGAWHKFKLEELA